MDIKVAVDSLEFRKYIDKLKDKEIIYVFDKMSNEEFEELIEMDIRCMHWSLLNSVEINTSRFDIPCIKKCSLKDKIELPKRKDYKIGIIMPNCNYGNLLEKSIGSILKQTYKNWELIFVDDCSTDKSVEIAEKLLKGEPRAKIVRLKQKRLNGGTRNEAYLHLSDDVDYVYYVDSDDWLYDELSLERIVERLVGYPDVLFVGIASYRAGVTEVCRIPEYNDRYEAMQGWSGSCGKVIKKSLALRQECLYNEGTLKEDRNQHRRICIYMNSFSLLQKPVYVWNQENRKSVTTIREKVVWGTSTIRHYADTLQLYLSVKGLDKKTDEILEAAVRKTKKEMENGGDKQW